jgi:hypothetical protein
MKFTTSAVLALGLALVAAGASAGSDGDLNAGDVRDQTSAGRKLVKAPRPSYPPEERGRWTESCVALYFTVRPDGKTDEFVVLEVPRIKHARAQNTQTEAEQLQESRSMRRFVQPAIDALYRWEYTPAKRASHEIVVFRHERSEMGGQLMRFTARRLDLKTPDPRACTETLNPEEVRALVAKASAG